MLKNTNVGQHCIYILNEKCVRKKITNNTIDT